ncbi:hypothetical protein PFISCL1PPCAC_20936, partial [Pristionchus fissidentatus]
DMAEETVIRWEVDNVSKLTKMKYSPITFIADLPWRLAVKVKTVSNESYFTGFLYCNEESDCELWRVVHNTALVLINREDPNKSILEKMKTKCYEKGEIVSGRYLMEFTDLMDESKGFIKDDKVIVEARITIKKVEGVRKALTSNFKEPSVGWDNVILNIEGEKIHVCKQYLSVHSPYFTSLFSGDFVEKNLKEIKLKEVCCEEFIELLLVIYPSYRQITFDSYEFILALADRFQMKYATDQAETYVIKTNKLDTGAKLFLADQYRLPMLKIHCMNSFSYPEDVTCLKDTPEFIQFSDAMNSSLFKKLLELLN